MTTHSEDLVSLDELRSILSVHAGPDEPLERPTRHRLRHPRRANRRLVVAAVVAVALAVPALAFSGALGSPFGFSNHGTPIAGGGYQTLHALRGTGAKPGSLVKLATRDGVGVYAARRTKVNHPWASRLCFYAGPADRSSFNLGSGGCVKPWGNSGVFPSRAHPVWDMSSVGTSEFFSQLPPGSLTVNLLVGVAADGVRSVQVLALSNCQAVVTAPVVDNVYVATKLPVTAEALIVARDGGGKAVWQRSLTPGKQPACGPNGGVNRRAQSPPPPSRANGVTTPSDACTEWPDGSLIQRISAAAAAEGGCVDGGLSISPGNREPAPASVGIPPRAEPVAVGSYQGYFLAHAQPDGPVDPEKMLLYVYLPGAGGAGHVEYVDLSAKGLTEEQLIAAVRSVLPALPTSTTQTCTQNCR